MSVDAADRRSPWSHRLALATVLTAIPLLVFGGTVTTLEAGMAIDGWWVLEPGRGDHFLLFYPLEKWFRDAGTFVEHTHRLFGTAVGLLAIATWLVTWRTDARRSARWMAFGGLVAVCAQGALGGFRVLENSPQLAFLHGAFGQLVFALLAANAVLLSPRWRTLASGSAGPTVPPALAAELPTVLATFAIPVAYGAIFLGAWLRHASSGLALGAHLVGALAAAGMVFSLARRLRSIGARDAGAAPLLGCGRRLLALLVIQLLLGLASFWIVFHGPAPEAAGLHDSAFPTLHVLVGALLLAQLVAAALWVQRVAGPVDPVPVTRAARNGGAR